MPPNTPATHQANLLYHANVRHPPYFFPLGRVGYNVWTPSNPGLNHSWHINNLHNGNAIRGRPTLLEAAMRNPSMRNLLPYQNRMLANAVSPVQDTYAMMRAGIDGRVFQQYPPHLAMWQRYHRTAPHFRYLAVSSQPSIAEQLGMLRRPAPGQGPGQFPFAAEGGINSPFDTSLNGLPRSTLQRVGDAIGGFLGRRTEEPLPMPGFPAGFPRSVPTVRSFPGAPDPAPFNGVPESRDRGEARLMLSALRQEIQKFVRANSPMLPATERALGVLVASIDGSMNSPTLTRNHAMSSQMFFQSIVEMDIKARADRDGGRTETPEPPADQEA
ncbi:MAG TPA: hypothetical protein PKV72_02165 [Candidatus Peribacteria bacterium]|nr:hypothetical protein [Candidatus Peribacteria bacterium]